MEKYFIVTIDTEGDNLWERATISGGIREIKVENAKYIERFQLLCDKYNFIPTYFVDYEMANAEYFVSQSKEWLVERKCEIGMHMHAWNTPPSYNLKFNRKGHNPYAGEYPRKILWKKMCLMTDVLENKFGIKPTSHRGGRWYIDGWYIDALIDLGYIVDCSITPGISWKNTIGNIKYGPDYSNFPNRVCMIHKNNIDINFKHWASNSILEVPPTIIASPFVSRLRRVWDHPEKAKTLFHEKIWLRPNGRNLEDLLYIVRRTKDKKYIEFMLHSSELMPGGSPNFKNAQSIEKLYSDLEILFSEIAKMRVGITTTGYANLWKKFRGIYDEGKK